MQLAWPQFLSLYHPWFSLSFNFIQIISTSNSYHGDHPKINEEATEESQNKYFLTVENLG